MPGRDDERREPRSDRPRLGLLAVPPKGRFGAIVQLPLSTVQNYFH
jgi:hypothetical protein